MKLSDFRDAQSRDVRKLKWPGTEREIGMLLLTVGEIQQCHFRARAWFRKQAQEVDKFSESQLDREEEFQMVAAMLCEPDSKTGDEKIVTIDEVRKKLLPSEVNFFALAHSRAQIEIAADWQSPDMKK